MATKKKSPSLPSLREQLRRAQHDADNLRELLREKTVRFLACDEKLKAELADAQKALGIVQARLDKVYGRLCPKGHALAPSVFESACPDCAKAELAERHRDLRGAASIVVRLLRQPGVTELRNLAKAAGVVATSDDDRKKAAGVVATSDDDRKKAEAVTLGANAILRAAVVLETALETDVEPVEPAGTWTSVGAGIAAGVMGAWAIPRRKAAG